MSYTPGLGSITFHGAENSIRVMPIDFMSFAQILKVARSRQGAVQSQRSMLNSRESALAWGRGANNISADSTKMIRRGTIYFVPSLTQ